MTAIIASQLNVGLFIDAENSPHTGFSKCLEFCKSLGDVKIMRCYGSNVALEKWKKELAEHPIRPMLTPLFASKANASDFAIVIDAVSVIHQKKIDSFVIFSDDSDFSQLAMYIREIGLKAYGVGSSKATENYRSQFDSFKILTSSKINSAKKKPVAVTSGASKTELTPDFKGKVVKALTTALKGNNAGHLTIQSAGQILAKAFGHKSYYKGHGSLQKFLSKIDGISVSEKSVTLKTENFRK